jgi:hypothetical protein
MAFDRSEFELRRAIAEAEGKLIHEWASPPDNVVSVADRKNFWTVEEALAVAARAGALNVSIVADLPNGTTEVFNSRLKAKDMLFHAKVLEIRAMEATL